MLEKEMTKALKVKLKFMPVTITDIETGSTEVGVPDLHFRTNIHDIWIEEKEIKRWPLKSSTLIRPRYRPGQFRWLKKQQELGGKSLLLLTYKKDWYMLNVIKKEYTKKEFCELNLMPKNINRLEPIDLLHILNSV